MHGYLVKSGHVVSDISINQSINLFDVMRQYKYEQQAKQEERKRQCVRTDRLTDMLITIFHSPTRAEQTSLIAQQFTVICHVP